MLSSFEMEKYVYIVIRDTMIQYNRNTWFGKVSKASKSRQQHDITYIL